MATLTWTGKGSNNLVTTKENWLPAQVPTSNDTLDIGSVAKIDFAGNSGNIIIDTGGSGTELENVSFPNINLGGNTVIVDAAASTPPSPSSNFTIDGGVVTENIPASVNAGFSVSTSAKPFTLTTNGAGSDVTSLQVTSGSKVTLNTVDGRSDFRSGFVIDDTGSLELAKASSARIGINQGGHAILDDLKDYTGSISADMVGSTDIDLGGTFSNGASVTSAISYAYNATGHLLILNDTTGAQFSLPFVAPSGGFTITKDATQLHIIPAASPPTAGVHAIDGSGGPPPSATLSIAAPISLTVQQSKDSPISGVSIAEPSTTSGETFAVALADTNGVLAADTKATGGGGTITPSNSGKILSINGTIDQVNADLSTLTDNDPSIAPDTITVNASDSNKGTATPASIAVTVSSAGTTTPPPGSTIPPAITDTTQNPIVVKTGDTVTPWSAITVADTIGVTEKVTTTATDGTIHDPNGGGTFDSTVTPHTFVESGLVTGDPTFATTLLDRLDFTAPSLPDGSGEEVQSVVTVGNGNGSAPAPKPIIIDVVTRPAVQGDLLNQPVAVGSSIRPFATTLIKDDTFNSSATDTVAITAKDSSGTATDADGLLTGVGLSKTGVGTYALPLADIPQNITSELRGLSFATQSAGTTTFDVAATNTKSSLTGTSTDSVLAIANRTGADPIIANTKSGQTVTSGSAIKPFAPVTVSDPNPNPSDAAIVTLLGSNGNSTDANGSLSGKGLAETGQGSGVYTIAAADPTTISNELNELSFKPPPLANASPITTTMKIDVTDVNVNTTATDSNTSVTEIQSPSVTGNFLISNQTTGETSVAAGSVYTGPVAGLDRDIILVTHDNLNVTAGIPNVFIHTGSGDDAISAAGGHNILDGSTGSNFLTGSSGTDEFYLDARSIPPTSPGQTGIWSTVVGMHPGDVATVWGVTPADFAITTTENMGAAGATGLTWDFAGKNGTDAKLTLAGFGSADMGKLGISFGETAPTDGLPAAAFMQIADHG